MDTTKLRELEQLLIDAAQEQTEGNELQIMRDELGKLKAEHEAVNHETQDAFKQLLYKYKCSLENSRKDDEESSE